MSPSSASSSLLLVVRMGTRLGAGQKPSAQHGRLRPQRQDGNHAAGIGDAAGGDDRPRGDGIHDPRDQGQGGDFSGHVAARLDALRDDDVHAGGRRPSGLRDRADLMEDLHARGVGTPHVRRRIAPEEREDGHALFQADGDLILDGEVEEQVHAERLGGERPHAADLLAEDRRRAELCLQDAEAAGVAHRRDEFGAGQVGPHRRGDDRVFDPQHVAESGFHGHFDFAQLSASFTKRARVA